MKRLFVKNLTLLYLFHLCFWDLSMLIYTYDIYDIFDIYDLYMIYFHLSLKQLLCHFKKVLQTIDQNSSLWDGGTGCQKKKHAYGLARWHWKQPFPQPAILIHACLISPDIYFLPCPWELSSSCWLLGFADFTLWNYSLFIRRSFCRGKSNHFLKSIWM